MGKGMNRDVLVIGGGIAGMQSALLLAEKDRRVHVLDSAPAIGGFFPLLDRTFPTNSCGVCFMSPKPPAYCPIYESDFHENIQLLTNADVTGLTGQAGNFELSYVQNPRHVDTDKCTLCDRCTEVCPVEVDRELGVGAEKRKAIHLPFAQAIPRCYVIDAAACTRCGRCVEACAPGAISLDEQPRAGTLNVGAIVLGFGFEPFRGEHKGEYGLGRYQNVVSSIQYERMLSFSGPTGGLPGRPSDGRRPGKVAFIQCVGSRDPACDQGYCSSICCMYATKQAMVSKDRDKALDAAIFYMDIRAMGKNYERYYERAKAEYGVRYLRSAVSTVRELQRSKRLLVAYGTDDGELLEEEFDMVVLSVGFTPPAKVGQAAECLGVSLNEYGFCLTDEFRPTQTSVPGIFVAGAFREPRDIPETVVEASAAAADVSQMLDDFEPAPADEGPADQAGAPDEQALRVGVFLCDSKGTLAEALDLDEVTRGLTQDPEVVCVAKIDVSSLREGVDAIADRVAGSKLNRAVVAGHSGRALGKALQRGCEAVASGSCLLAYANIGEQCANVHGGDPATATRKARSLLRAGVRKAKLAASRRPASKTVYAGVLVVGGGVAGLSSSLSLAEQGMDVTLVEKSDELGGNARQAHVTLKGSDIKGLVEDMVSKAQVHPKIQVLMGAQLKSLEGTWGSYRSRVSVGDEDRQVLHGAVLFAVGGEEVLPDCYLYGEHPDVVTQRTFERLLHEGHDSATKAKTVVMIQCVQSRDEQRPYCSRVCCTHALKNVLKLKELNPDAAVYVLYRDVRSYGFYEKYYHQARDKGSVFVRYDPAAKPEVFSSEGALRVSFLDPVAGERMNLAADMVVLSSGIKPAEDIRRLAEIAGAAVDEDGFFAEANPKSAPLDAVDRGKYFCGLCHSPNHIEDAISQGKAAAARAAALLWSGVAELAANQAYVNDRRCSGCGLCVSACPYQARVLDETSKKAKVLADLCKGCGTCVVSCPNGASEQYDFERSTVMDVLDEMMA